jgi:lysyl-tRNA synthetase class 2
LVERATLYRFIREFFYSKDVLEVSTPLLASHTVTDTHIASFSVGDGTSPQYLQTSPEFAMKKLLANGAGAIYSLGPVFRQGESGKKHNPEFAMLEWYQPGFSLEDLMKELVELFCGLQSAFGLEPIAPVTLPYEDLFKDRFGINPHQVEMDELRSLAAKQFPHDLQHLTIQDDGERNDLLDLLFSLGVEADLVEPTFVTRFPASQSSLARVIQVGDVQVSMRTELYWKGYELANGYDELRDGFELGQRMARDNRIRRSRGLPEIEPDTELLKALPKMPECAGVALGVDRLLMLLIGVDQITDVI